MNFLANTAENCYKQHRDFFIKNLISNNNIVLDLTYECNYITHPPVIKIEFDQKPVLSKKIGKGMESINLNLELEPGKHNLQISMLGKDDKGTLVQNGIVIQDTFIKITDFKINNYTIHKDFDFFRDSVKYFLLKNQAKALNPLMGFWEDAVLILDFECPFDLWYNKTSKANARIADSLSFSKTDNIEEVIKNFEISLEKLS